MARTKTVADNVLIGLIDDCLLTECKGNPDKLKLPQIADYVRKNGYPTYAVESLRRNELARKHIDKLKKSSPDKAFVQVVSYKTLDVLSFMEKNRSPAAMKSALTQLDSSYKNVADAAVEIYHQFKALSKEVDGLKAEIAALKEKNTNLSATIADQRSTLNVLQNENGGLKRVVETYVYPDIAMDLLVKEGVFSADIKYVNSENVDLHVITGDTAVATTIKNEKNFKTKSGSQVIKGLFKNFED